MDPANPLLATLESCFSFAGDWDFDPRIWFASLMRKVVPLIVVEWLLDSEI